MATTMKEAASDVMWCRVRRTGFLMILLGVLLASGTIRAQTSYDVATVAETGMVSSAHPLASQAGLEILQKGGNAIDAAAAVQFALNVVEPAMTGIGGGAFIMIYSAEEGRVIAIDAREEAPARYHERVFLDEEGNVIPFAHRRTGGNAAGVPGTLAGFAKAVELYGTLPLAEILEPAIRLAEGFELSELDARRLNAAREDLARFPSTAAIYVKPDGFPWQAGDLFVNRDLAQTFRLIAEQGPDVFYRGEIADDIVRAVKESPINPGVMEKSDLESYRAVLREPVRGTYRGYEVVSMAPPTSGGMTLLEILNILEAYDLARLGWGSLDALHLLNEAQKVAFADRNLFMADADWADVPVSGLISKAFAAERRRLIDPVHALPAPVPAGDPWAYETVLTRPASPFGSNQAEEGAHTTHFTVVDGERNVVAVTSTIESEWGNFLVVPGRGFLLNNQLTDFDPVPVAEDGSLVANRPEGGKRPRRTALNPEDRYSYGGKRPRSSMTPTLVFKDGQPFLAVGSPGGSRIIGIVLNVLTNVIDFGMDPQQAITAPRVVNRGGPMEMEAELYDASPGLVAALEARGHQVQRTESYGGAHAILIDPATGRLLGGADPRRGGSVAGY